VRRRVAKRKEAPVKKKGKKKTKTEYGQGAIFPELFSNTAQMKRTIRIDSKLLAEAESEDPKKKKSDAAEALRQVVATVGKPGQPGEHVRCVVSVSMLTEGWDANNVTHILGIRAFGSQLLCEQVVGRGIAAHGLCTRPRNGAVDRGVCGCVRDSILGDPIQRPRGEGACSGRPPEESCAGDAGAGRRWRCASP
jgi:type III restriction enzyme